MMLPTPGAGAELERLSIKEREVLERIIAHKSLKVIAHELGVSLAAVDKRLKSARVKLGADDKYDAARLYSGLLDTCRESTCGFAELGPGPEMSVIRTSEPHSGPIYTYQDSAMIEVAAPWFGDEQRGAVPGLLDDKFVRLWRIVAIPGFAAMIAVLAIALLAMAKLLSELL